MIKDVIIHEHAVERNGLSVVKARFRRVCAAGLFSPIKAQRGVSRGSFARTPWNLPAGSFFESG